LSPALRDIFHTPIARYSLFVLKLPLNTNQPADQPTWKHWRLGFINAAGVMCDNVIDTVQTVRDQIKSNHIYLFQ